MPRSTDAIWPLWMTSPGVPIAEPKLAPIVTPPAVNAASPAIENLLIGWSNTKARLLPVNVSPRTDSVLLILADAGLAATVTPSGRLSSGTNAAAPTGTSPTSTAVLMVALLELPANVPRALNRSPAMSRASGVMRSSSGRNDSRLRTGVRGAWGNELRIQRLTARLRAWDIVDKTDRRRTHTSWATRGR